MSSFVSKGSAVTLESVKTSLTPSHIRKMNRLNGRLWAESQNGIPGGPLLKGNKDGEDHQGNSDTRSGTDSVNT